MAIALEKQRMMKDAKDKADVELVQSTPEDSIKELNPINEIQNRARAACHAYMEA